MSRSAYIAVGPESSGTRLLAEILIAGGCHGEATHEQRFDRKIPDGLSPIVWRRSIPHENRDLNLSRMVSRLGSYLVTVVVIVRNFSATEVAQVDQRLHVHNAGLAQDRMTRGLLSLFRQIARLGLDYTLITYESLILHPELAQRALWKRLGLPGGDSVEIRDENRKRLEVAA